jgi:hypothetical protein
MFVVLLAVYNILTDCALVLYAALTQSEKNCARIVKKQIRCAENLSDEEWRTLTESHRTLLHLHQDFFRASHNPSSSLPLRNLTKKYLLPGRMWEHGIYNFLELLRYRWPSSRDHFLAFLRLAYAMTGCLMETVSSLEETSTEFSLEETSTESSLKETWTESLGDLARYWNFVSKTDAEIDYTVWSGVAKFWYGNVTGQSRNGRIQHHLAITETSNNVRELFHYSNSLISVAPFEEARNSMMTFFNLMIGSLSRVGQPLGVERAFVLAYALLFTGHSVSLFDKMTRVFISGIDAHINRERDLFQIQGSQMACVLCAALLGFGNPKSLIWKALLAREEPRCEASRSAVEAGEPTREGVKVKLDKQHEYGGPMQHTLDRAPRLSESANVTDELIGACLFLRKAICTLFERAYDKNVLPFAYVILAFLKRIPDVYGIPWAIIAKFLNTAMRSSAAGVQLESMEFPYKTNDINLPLPEDHTLRGLRWAHQYFHKDFFKKRFISEYDRTFKLSSDDARRANRCLWLGYQLSLVSKSGPNHLYVITDF